MTIDIAAIKSRCAAAIESDGIDPQLPGLTLRLCEWAEEAADYLRIIDRRLPSSEPDMMTALLAELAPAQDPKR